jgi:hypothetical protein
MSGLLGKLSFGNCIRPCGRGLRLLLYVGFALWSILAVYYSNLPTHVLRAAAAILCACILVWIAWRIRPWRIARFALLAVYAAVVVWFLLIPPSNSRDWQPDVALLPFAEVNGALVTIHNIRNCDYRSEYDYTVRHYDKTFDLEKLRTVDFYVVYWGSPWIAHTMLSFGFEGGDYVCFSIETRKEKGESYSAVQGFFRRYELTYVVADERDLVRLRTNFRGEQVYLYRLNADVGVARSVLLAYLAEVNRLKDRPEWYNALTSNCTTNIRGHTKPYARNARFDWRVLINGCVDGMAYERGTLETSLPFKELKARSLINERAKAADGDAGFSSRIREGLPGVSCAAPPFQPPLVMTVSKTDQK